MKKCLIFWHDWEKWKYVKVMQTVDCDGETISQSIIQKKQCRKCGLLKTRRRKI